MFSLPWCVRFAAQIIGRCHRGTDGMTGYRRANGRSIMTRRYVPWFENVFYLEQSKGKVQVEAKWHEGIFLRIKDESEIAVVGSPHGIVFFCEKHPEEMVCCSTALKESRENYNLELREKS